MADLYWIGVERMSELDLKLYYFSKWLRADNLEEKFQILVDFVTTTDEKFAEHFFGEHFEDIWYMDKYDIEDYMLENAEELQELWLVLIKYDKENEG